MSGGEVTVVVRDGVPVAAFSDPADDGPFVERQSADAELSVVTVEIDGEQA